MNLLFYYFLTFRDDRMQYMIIRYNLKNKVQDHSGPVFIYSFKDPLQIPV
jgi:hypothetical protein